MSDTSQPPAVSQERIQESSARAKRWLARHIVQDGREPELDEGDCTICGGAAGEGHEPTDPCGIMSDLLLALYAATEELKIATEAMDMQAKAHGYWKKWAGDYQVERDVALARAAEAAEYAQNIMVELGPVVADAAIVGHRYGWPEVFGIVMATKRAFYAQQEELSRLRAERTWQPIETAPKDREVMLWWPYWSKRPTIGYWKLDRWIAENAPVDSADVFLSDGPTHWQPLPSPPGAAQE